MLVPARMNLAFSCQAQGKLELGKFNFTGILAHDPSNATALEGRSIIKLLCGNKSGALADVSHALTFSGSSQQLGSMLHTTRALIFESMEDFASMEQDAESAVRHDPESYHAQFSLGRLLMHRRQYRTAIGQFTKCLEIRPGDADTLLNRGVCFFLENSASQAEGVLIKAREDFTAAIALRPKELAAFFNRAVIHQRLGHVDEAMADIDKVLELMPDSRAHLLRMRIRRSQTAQTEIGNKDDTAKLALEDFRAALELDEELATSQLYL